MEYLLTLNDVSCKGLEPQEIPIESVVIIEDAYPRLQINKKRVEMFRDLFRNGSARVPPIRVVPLLCKDTQSRYVFVDGRHRLLGMRSSSGTIQALVLPGAAFTPEELETPEAKRKIRLMASLCNSKHGMQFSRKEIRRNVIELYMMKTPLRELYLLAPERTVRHYLKEIRCEEKKEREKMKVKVLELRAAGYTQKKAAYEIGITQGTVSKIESNLRRDKKRGGKKPESKEGPFNEKQVFPAAALPNGIDASSGWTVEIHPPAGKTDGPLRHEDVNGTFENVYNAVRKMRHSKTLESLVKQYLIPLLTEKFATVHELIQSAGYATENELLVREREGLIRRIADMDGKCRDIQHEKESLSSELAARKNYCNWQCRFSRERYLKEQKNYLSSLAEDTEDLELYIRLVDAAGAVLAGGAGTGSALSDLDDLLTRKNCKRKEFRERLENSLEAPSCGRPHHRRKIAGISRETGDPAEYCLAISRHILLKIAANTAYKFLSTFDYCLQVRHGSEDLDGRLSRFFEIIRGSDILTEDLDGRIKEYRSTLAEELAQCT